MNRFRVAKQADGGGFWDVQDTAGVVHDTGWMTRRRARIASRLLNTQPKRFISRADPSKTVRGFALVVGDIESRQIS